MADVPPGPRSWFGFAEMALMQADLLSYHESLQQRYGDIVSQRIGPYRMVNIYHPDHVRELLVDHARSFEKMPRVRKIFAQWNGNSSLISEGDDWLRKRRLVQPAFSPKRFAAYGEVITRFTARLADSWQVDMASNGHADVEITAAMTQLTLEIIAKTMFDEDVQGRTSELAQAVAILSGVALHELQAPWSWPDWLPTNYNRRKRWAMHFLDATVWRIVRERRSTGEDRGDLLSMLLLAADESAGANFTDAEARNEAMTFLLAGHDTTAAGLSWIFYLLAIHPEIQDRAAAELAALQRNDRIPTPADLPRLPLIEHVVRESLRLYPPAIGIFMRQSITMVQIGGYTLPRGTLVQAISWITHRDERWFTKPIAFDPDRWSPERAREIHPGAWYPFGLGPRACVGQSFAMLEMILIVATLLARFRWILVPGHPPVTPQVGMSLRPHAGVRLRWQPREFA